MSTSDTPRDRSGAAASQADTPRDRSGAAASQADASRADQSGAPWWRDAVIYQIYVRSFADADGDGLGDLAGITAHLDHVAGLGADAVWLTPFYPSPLHDGGYDVADYRAVDPRLGSLDDFDALVARAHALGLKVLVDVVPNHTSSEHPWFVEALAAPPGSAARDRYIFRPGLGEHGEAPPSDWRSVFGGPAWQPVGDGQWYLHLFDVSQPDLNWDAPEVREEFDSILRFWLDRGVDGFRIDVAHGLTKDLREPLRPVGNGADEQQLLSAIGGHDHPYWDRDDVHELYRHWRGLLDSYSPPRMACAEAWVASADRRARYVRHDELHQAFNFDFLRAPWDAAALRATIDESLQASAQVGATTTWVLSNHDVMREVTRYALPPADEDVPWVRVSEAPEVDVALGRRRARAAALLMLALPGSAYVYQGEELGLPEVLDLPEDVLVDPVWERSGHRGRGRDGCRVPIPWTREDPSYGFSPGASSDHFSPGASSDHFSPGASPDHFSPGASSADPWLPQPSAFGQLSVAAQTGVAGSTLELYRSAMALRRRYGGDGPMAWLPGPEATAGDARATAGDAQATAGDAQATAEVLAFTLQTGLVCQVNLGPTPVPLAGGELLLASGPLDGGLLPTDTAAWVLAGPRR